MKGFELSRAFYEAYGKPMLEEFKELMPYLAVGMFGSGSECLGYDDDISKDHDFEPGFCIFLPGEDVVDRRKAFLLERAYAKLPKEFMGFKRSLMQPVGGARHGIFRTDEFFNEKIGSPDGSLSLNGWLTVPQQALLEVTNGEIFFDNYGDVSKIRGKLEFYPEDICLKKLAGQLLIMAQSGQYNYKRCIGHGETAAAQLAAFEFVKSTMAVIFLLNKKYMPYYKWSFKALSNLPKLSNLYDSFEYLITTDNENAEIKKQIIEDICAIVSNKVKEQGIVKESDTELERLAYKVNDSIDDNSIRNLNIFYGV